MIAADIVPLTEMGFGLSVIEFDRGCTVRFEASVLCGLPGCLTIPTCLCV